MVAVETLKAYKSSNSPADILVLIPSANRRMIHALSLSAAWSDASSPVEVRARHYDRVGCQLEGAEVKLNGSFAREPFLIDWLPTSEARDESRVPQTARLQLTV